MMKFAEDVSKLRPQRKNIIPSSDATKELKDMEPLFLLFLAGTVECRNKPLF